MGTTSKDTAPTVYAIDGFEGRYDDVDGQTIGFESHTADADLSPLFAGLPDDHCQCPHWGVVLKGTMTYRYVDGSEDLITAGQAYYARPGHVPLLTAGTELVEFSPSDQLAVTIEVIMRNLEAMGVGAQ